jgi:glycosyltransferase involved in cell wall biosynthesis
MKISYLVTCHNEINSLRNLFEKLNNYTCESDEIIVLDDFSDNIETKEILDSYKNRFQIVPHALNNNYGAHKNFGIEMCKGDFIFQMDGDELPPDTLLGENIHEIIYSNPEVEAYAVPRINDFIGVNNTHAKQWGWRLSLSPTYNRPIVNWPDYQFRIFKREYPRISFLRRLHEKIEGYMSYVCLPMDETYALYHDKTIETQVATNLRYNVAFTEEENQGHNVFGDKKK